MIPISILNFHISADKPIYFGDNPGSRIRGALYQALSLIYDTGQEVHSRDDYNINPVAWLLRLEDDQTSGGKQVLRPIAIRPPLVRTARQTSFGIAFFGSGHRCIPMVVTAVQATQTIGIGLSRQPFQLVRVDYIDPLTNTALPLLDQRGNQLNVLPDPLSEMEYHTHAQTLGRTVTLRFLTPTQIVMNGQLSSKPDFVSIFQRLVERLQFISENYMSHPVKMDFDQELSRAREASLIHHAIQWHTGWTGFQHPRKYKPISGFTGSLTYDPVNQALLPWLLVGQSTHIGQNTIKGCGWYRVEDGRVI